MSRTKVHQPEPPLRYRPVEAFAGSESPEWNDMLRGILVALVGKYPSIWNYRSTKEKILDVLSGEVATVLQNTDPKMNVWAVLEKWCWMMEMYARATEFRSEFNWRYTNSMNFLSASPPAATGAYIGCLNNDRFIELTNIYATTEEEKTACRLGLARKTKKFAIGVGTFSQEMRLYEDILKMPPPPAPITVVVSSSQGVPSVQLLGSPASTSYLLQQATVPVLAPAEVPVRARRGRSAAKYAVRPRVTSTTQETTVLPTSVSEILSGLATSIATSPVTTSSSPTSTSPLTIVEEPPLKVVIIKEEPIEPARTTDELSMTDNFPNALIEAVRDRQELWDPSLGAQKADKERLWKEVSDSVQKYPGGEHFDDNNLPAFWRQLCGILNLPTPGHLNERQRKFFEDLKEKSQPIRSKQGAVENGISPPGACSMSNGFHGQDIQAQFTSIFGPNQRELSPRENQPPPAKRSCLNSPANRVSPNTKRNDEPTPQVVTTWVPPKEDAFASAFAAVAAANPTATAQIMSASHNLPFNGLFTVDAGFINKGMKPQINGTHSNKRSSGHSDGKEDKWNLLGRLVEQTCRELEVKDLEMAVHLQRELGEVLCKYQLATIKKS